MYSYRTWLLCRSRKQGHGEEVFLFDCTGRDLSVNYVLKSKFYVLFYSFKTLARTLSSYLIVDAGQFLKPFQHF